MKRARRVAAVIVLAFAAALLLLRDSASGPAALMAGTQGGADVSRAAFDHWLARDAKRARDFSAFAAYVGRAGHADTVPSWMLLRANNGECEGQPFVLPPRNFWPNIVPALDLVRDRIIPAIGPVEPVSAFRTPAVNLCARGATHSRHLSFSALDLIPLQQPDATTSFRRLCARWRAAGSGSRWGLGAYFDAARPEQNQVGRFHVDATGWRSWGFSYGHDSSGCNAL